MPGRASVALGMAASAAGIAGCGAALWHAGHSAASFSVLLAASAVAALGLARSEECAPSSRRGAREVAMAIVPWGVVITPDTEPRVLRWPAVRKVSVDVTHTLRGGTPAIVASLVTVETEREILAGRTPGQVELERLLVGLEGYAEEASRPVACDLDGTEPAYEDATDPVVALLLRQAHDLCTSSRGAAELSLPPGDYRSVATRAASPETIEKLRAALHARLDTPADPRPLAAIIAATLRAQDLVPDLLRLVSSPHPMVAAVAKAAALRLGAPLNRAGSVEEVAAFLFEEDLELIRAWADEGVATPEARGHI